MPFLRNIYSRFYRNFLFPLFEVKVPPAGKIRRHLQELEQSQWASSEDLGQRQARKLQALISHAYRHSRYYRRLMDERGVAPEHIRHPQDLARLPFLDKTILQNRLEEIAAENFRSRRIRYNTGGSTGRPVNFYIPAGVEKSWSSAAALRGYGWWGWRPGLPMAYFWSSPVDRAMQEGWKMRLYRSLSRDIYLDAYRITPALLGRFARLLNRYPGIFLKGYPSSLEIFCDYLQREGKSVAAPGGVFTTGETLYDSQRAKIENTLGAPVADFYGQRETNAIIFQCPESGLYHVNDENVIVEIRPVNPDRPAYGEIVITDLENWATPFIRYRTGDRGELARESCPCGRHLTTFRKFYGRDNDVLKLENGREIVPIVFPHYFKDLAGIRQFQVVQVAGDRLILKLVVSPEWQSGTEQKIRRDLQGIVGNDVTIDIRRVNEIPAAGSGKTRFVMIDYSHQESEDSRSFTENND